LKIQELYDVTSVPAIANGKVTPLVHLLAPNQRVVQITNDLAGFWKNSYEQIKKDLKGRYPKHEWR
jgi:ATP-dependent helicase HrpB